MLKSWKPVWCVLLWWWPLVGKGLFKFPLKPVPNPGKNNRHFWGYILLHAFTVFRFLKYFFTDKCFEVEGIICTMKLNSADSVTSLLNGTCSMCHSFLSFSQRSFLPFRFINLALSNSSLMLWSFESTIQQCLILLIIFTLALCRGNLFCSCPIHPCPIR